jgi:hypothetical protein
MGGFTASQDQSNADYCGKVFNYSVDAAHSTLLCAGDVIVITGTADASGIGGVDAASAGDAVSGVIAGVTPQYEGEMLSETGLPASTAGTVQCHIDPMLNFDVDVANGPLVAANVGLNADIVATAASKLGGLTVSNMTLNATGVAVTQTLQFRIVRLLEDENGVLGNRAQVRFNNTTISDGAEGV